MDNAHHVHSDRRVKAKLLGDPGYFIRSQHNAESKQYIAGEGEKPQEQKRCLHKRRQADRRHLLHPLHKTIRIAAGQREHIQCANCHLDKQDTAPFDIVG